MITLLSNNLSSLDDNKVGFANYLIEEGKKVFIGDVNSLRFVDGKFLAEGGFYLNYQSVYASITADTTRAINDSEVVWLLNQPAPGYGIDGWSLLYALSQFVPMVNDPATMLLVNNKAFVSSLDRDYRPDLIVSPFFRDHNLFAISHGSAVIKALGDGCGNGVFLVKPEDSNAKALQQFLTGGGSGEHIHSDKVTGLKNRYVTSQEVLSNRIEYRVILCGGEVIGAHGRVPVENEHRGNISQGAAYYAIDDHQLKSIKERWALLAVYLRNLGINYCGLDVLEGKVIEFNLVDPGGLWVIYTEENINLFPQAWRLISESLANKRK